MPIRDTTRTRLNIPNDAITSDDREEWIRSRIKALRDDINARAVSANSAFNVIADYNRTARIKVPDDRGTILPEGLPPETVAALSAALEVTIPFRVYQKGTYFNKFSGLGEVLFEIREANGSAKRDPFIAANKPAVDAEVAKKIAFETSGAVRWPVNLNTDVTER